MKHQIRLLISLIFVVDSFCLHLVGTIQNTVMAITTYIQRKYASKHILSWQSLHIYKENMLQNTFSRIM
jgi:hypothetical protein